ncbi:hypothetical protein [Moritella sp. F3]|uniref:Y-family DNA polymerase n=1 Tax=Moritella sp. F3 TaxID=2718882 RepID=UPI0018E0FBB1|nr:hypothetical protein [Moritella sp. F3]GIC77098.1 DNA polymerase V subunit UmuC [Moritella sp. F1]GIC82217.1 DNA polymerase V subunit UmuC [Moritella sp. F3]
MGLVSIIDGTRFYATSAGILHPELRGRPLVVTSGENGIVIAANRLATDQCGMKKFEPVFKQKEIISRHDVLVVEANFNLFGHHSNQFQSIIMDYFDDCSSYSIDEVFALVPSNVVPIDYLREMRSQVYKLTRTAVSAAASLNCTLAKACSWASKSLTGYNGLCVIDSMDEMDEILKKMPIGSIWGIGRSMNKTLVAQGMTKAIDLKHADPTQMKKLFGKNIVDVISELNGRKVLNWKNPGHPNSKIVIGSSKSYKERLHNKTDVHQALAHHIHIVCQKVRAQHSIIKCIIFSCSTSSYDHQPYSKSIKIKLAYPTSDTSAVLVMLNDTINDLLPHSGNWVPIYRINVSATDLKSIDVKQSDLFAPPEDERKMQVFDLINARFGKNTMFLGAKGAVPKCENVRPLQLKHPHSRWRDVPDVFC